MRQIKDTHKNGLCDYASEEKIKKTMVKCKGQLHKNL